MGKRIRVQRRGRGGSVFRAHVYRRVAPAIYPALTGADASGRVDGRILDILHDPGRGSPLAFVQFSDGKSCCLSAPEGLLVSQTVSRGADSPPEIGNILPVGKIPEGTMICNIEREPGDGGKIAKASGAYAMVVSHRLGEAELRLPSGASMYVPEKCRATIGVVSGAGRAEKPFMKAGARRRWLLSKGRLWPITKGQAMVAASHPHGGGRHKHAGKPTTVSRNTPPGRKVGLIAARQSGRSKRTIRSG
jgi:large subunit ribosomal protein L2